jgi:hypothetical protein
MMFTAFSPELKHGALEKNIAKADVSNQSHRTLF